MARSPRDTSNAGPLGPVFFLMRNEVTREAWAAFQEDSPLFRGKGLIKTENRAP